MWSASKGFLAVAEAVGEAGKNYQPEYFINRYLTFPFSSSLPFVSSSLFHCVANNPADLWQLRHWLQFLQLRTWIHDNLCYLTIKSDTGQHSQFLRCFFIYQVYLSWLCESGGISKIWMYLVCISMYQYVFSLGSLRSVWTCLFA